MVSEGMQIRMGEVDSSVQYHHGDTAARSSVGDGYHEVAGKSCESLTRVDQLQSPCFQVLFGLPKRLLRAVLNLWIHRANRRRQFAGKSGFRRVRCDRRIVHRRNGRAYGRLVRIHNGQLDDRHVRRFGWHSNGRLHRRFDRRLDGRLHRRFDRRLDGWLHGWLDRRFHGRLDRRFHARFRCGSTPATACRHSSRHESSHQEHGEPAKRERYAPHSTTLPSGVRSFRATNDAREHASRVLTAPNGVPGFGQAHSRSNGALRWASSR